MNPRAAITEDDESKLDSYVLNTNSRQLITILLKCLIIILMFSTEIIFVIWVTKDIHLFPKTRVKWNLNVFQSQLIY